MATPTITSVSPARGHSAGGTLLDVTGTGFRLPDAPPSTGPVPTPSAPMRAFLGGVEARRVDVISATRLLILTAPHSLPAGADALLVALELRNVGPYGEQIGAETVTLANAYTYARPALDATHPSTTARVVRELVEYLKRGTIEEVVITQHVDFDDAPTDVLRKMAIAKLPAVFLAGPRFRRNVVHTMSDPKDVQVTANVVMRHRAPRVVDLVFTIGCITDNATMLFGLMEGLTELLEREPSITIRTEPNVATSEEMAVFELQWEDDLQADSAANESNILTAVGTIAVLGVPILGRPGFDSDMATGLHPSFPEDGDGSEIELSLEPSVPE